MTVKMRFSRLRLGAVAAVAAGLLSACATAMPGSAAVVGDTRISQAEVGERVSALNSVLGFRPDQPSEVLARGVVLQEVNTELILQTAERLGVRVTPALIDQAVNDEVRRLGGPEGLEKTAAESFIPPAQIRDFIRSRLALSLMAEQLAPGQGPDVLNQVAVRALTATSEQVGVSVAPRYGEWSTAQLQIVPAPNPVSKPAESAESPLAELQVPQAQ